jgi:thiamine-monophosphate kinase
VSSDSAEFALIDWIRRRAGSHARVPVGIGDDAAVLAFPSAAQGLITVDMLMEGIHFTFPTATPRQAGRKALAVNLSDIAAMAGRPLAAFASLALPRSRGADFARELFAGMEALAREFDVAMAGGDTNAWDGPLVVSVTVVGEATSRGPVRRSGAQPGDWIIATGEFGSSLAGKHLAFEPRVREALELHEAAPLSAMIDVSDGLAADLYHILDESRTGAVIYERAIPVSKAAENAGDGRSPLDHALGDGEDFELLFTLAATDAQKLLEQPPCAVRLTHIGEINDSGVCELIDPAGNHRTLERLGWTHEF